MPRLLAVLLVVAATACSHGSSSAPSASTAGPVPLSGSIAPGSGSAATEPNATEPGGISSPCGTRAAPPRVYDHVIWIWMENHRYDDVFGNERARYEAQLAGACGTATDYHDVGSPSLPNYIGATSGDTQGIRNDAAPSAHPLTVDNLFRQVRATGRAARSYEEAMPEPCALSSSGRYAVKHNPAAYYTGADDRDACARDDVPLGALDGGPFVDDLRRGSLPAFAFVTPDLCNDTHDCPVSTGDAFLASWVGAILSSDVYAQGRTAVFVVWDEDAPMPNLVISPSTHPGTVFDGRVDHYALLRTTEELLGIDSFLGAAATAPSMRAAFTL